MGFSYLGNRYWADVTRDERYFCQHLFNLAVCDGANKVLSCIKDREGNERQLDGEWEPAFEVCFYRDLWHVQGRKDQPHSLWRTFDLAFFSENAILILEAKVQQEFDLDQLESFTLDCARVQDVTNVRDVWIYGLASSEYEAPPKITEVFDGPLLTWRGLAEIYGNDKILTRADEVYNRNELHTWGKNNDGYVTGEKLIEAHNRGEEFWVGRANGLHGKEFCDDVESGDWRKHPYETSRQKECPNRNWFELSEFVTKVKAKETNSSSV